MHPILKKGDIILCKKVKSTQQLHRGQIIVVVQDKNINDNRKYLVKRIIGLPNEKITLENNFLQINDIEIKESYLKIDRENQLITSWETNSNQVVILGDNSLDSLDSRTFGTIEKTEIQFRFIKKIWPIC